MVLKIGKLLRSYQKRDLVQQLVLTFAIQREEREISQLFQERKI